MICISKTLLNIQIDGYYGCVFASVCAELYVRMSVCKAACTYMFAYMYVCV